MSLLAARRAPHLHRAASSSSSSSSSSPAHRPRLLLHPRCRYTSDPRGDRFAETVLFTAADGDDFSGALISPASQSVMMVLLEKRLPFRHALVRRGDDADAEFRELYSAATGAGARPPAAPLLADCGTIVAGASSSDARIILEFLAEKYRPVGTPLMPSNPAAAATMRLFVDVFSDAVVAPFRRYARAPPGDKAALERAKEALFEGWQRVDAFLLAHSGGAAAGFDALDAGAEMLFGQHRAFVVRPPTVATSRAAAAAEEEREEEEEEGTLDGRPPFAARGDDPAVDRDAPPHARATAQDQPPAYLLGPRAYSLAEVATTPHVARMAALLPALRGVELVAELKARGLARAADWCAASLARPSAVATDPTADEMVGGLNAAEWARV